ncbi:uncharacterized protein A1O9_05220 [Exophiala aquamarina CBS 119918]|uniref:Ketoreductase domain-containing protein n=1 Tax=Exophiala aquamarina CBS 119918 TaxID=1182545 RepID=A0A072PDF5_9EURO|nr:uncharacterized protein A1O9_05220 [Exophiala aquamarina CBS 119918]KEF57303.1 hypothetical protein A1O9_05220 [Exophiala aquamarina CBS 119918]
MAPHPAPTSTWHTKTYPSICPARPELSARGKAVVITGGGTGIGAETARYFAEAGASRIALIGRRVKPLLDTKASIDQSFTDIEVSIFSIDITKKAEVDETFVRFIGDGKLHILVSNAASIGPQDPIDQADDKLLEAIQQNLKGAFYIAQAFLRYASTDAVAINVSSSAAHLDFVPDFAAYSIAKMAIIRLWDSLAFAHPELSVFHVQPGVVDTAMNREANAAGIKFVTNKDDVSLPASFHVWLASPEARFLKGKFLWANWDVDELKGQAMEIKASAKLRIGLVGWPFQNGSQVSY